MSDNIVRIGVVGVGYWGPNIVRNLMTMNNVCLVGVCDLSDSALQRIKKLYPTVNIYHDVDELLKEFIIDAIIVSTPAGTHYPIARKALNLNLHVMVEKPLATSVSHAKDLISIAESKNLILMVGHTFLYSNFVNDIKKRIETKDLGDTLYIYSQRLSLGQIRDDVDVLWNLGPHDISIFNYWVGDVPKEVSAWGFSFLNKEKGISDVVFAKMVYKNGVSAHIHLSWLDPLKVRRIVVVGSKKMLVYNDTDNERPIEIFDKCALKEYIAPSDYVKFRYALRSGDITVPRIETAEPLNVELSHFRDCIIKQKKPLTDGYHALDVIAVLEAMSESLMNNGKSVEIKSEKR
jgi:predicted dehydrogenase